MPKSTSPSTSPPSRQEYFPGRSIPTETFRLITKYIDPATLPSARLVSRSWAPLMLEVLFAQRGFSISPFKNGMQRLEEVAQTIAMPSIHHLDIGLGIVDSRRLGLHILRNTPSVLLAKMSQDERTRWLRDQLLGESDKYLRYCRGEAFARLLLPLKNLSSITISHIENHISPSLYQRHEELLDDPEMDMQIYTLKQWASLPPIKFQGVLDILTRMSLSGSIALTHLKIESLPIYTFMTWDSERAIGTDVSARFIEAFSHLESLSLGLSCCVPNGLLSLNPEPSCFHHKATSFIAQWNILAIDTMCKVVSSMKNLRQLDLNWQISSIDEEEGCIPQRNSKNLRQMWNELFLESTFPNLETLRLSWFCMEKIDLFTFLYRHKDTLKNVDLGNYTFDKDDTSCSFHEFFEGLEKLLKLEQLECRDVYSISASVRNK
ncbi:hypothetical protein BELL_0324g00090 [Botrytis elliptica]|uniref:F-box domain-containing protein n=1 Tax=Botrytis elliptica TaxID=278938 RepID=A0A4Z1JRK5_9HELO|nr:hypothetical protein EAE99_003653 [Botrytis elliptica]TGO73882.1 hypothetical protein BELL_0324g00090 [Botrytis elliptica]